MGFFRGGISQILADVLASNNALKVSLFGSDDNIIESYSSDPTASTKALPMRNITGNSEQISAGIGTGGFAPAPINNNKFTALNEKNSISLDINGNVQTRSQIFTDEGSWRDDFPNTSLFTQLTGTISVTQASNIVTGINTKFLSEINKEYHLRMTSHPNSNLTKVLKVISDTELLLDEGYVGATAINSTAVKSKWHVIDSISTGTISVLDSDLILTSSVAIGDRVNVNKDADCSPARMITKVSISQRIINQEIHLGFSDSTGSSNEEIELIFKDTVATQLEFISKSSSNPIDTESKIVTIPFSKTTADKLKYEVGLDNDSVSLFIEDVLVAQNTNHIPNLYTQLNFYAEIKNGAVTPPASPTTLSIDYASLLNTNRIEIANKFKGDAISIKNTEDAHTLHGILTTNTNIADQVLLSYVIPAGKSFSIKGWACDNNATVLTGTIKIIKGNNVIPFVVPIEPVSPGTVDSNFHRSFTLPANSPFISVDYGNLAIPFGRFGEVVKVLVTPSANTATIWRFTLDFILR